MDREEQRARCRISEKVDPDTLARVPVACHCCCCLAAYSEQVVSKPTRGTVKKWAQPSARRKDACSKHIRMRPKPTPMGLRNFGVRWAQWTSRNMTRYIA